MESKSPRILIAGGGTGGHLFPALAIADELRNLNPTVKFMFVGTKKKIEARVVPMRGYTFQAIWISGLHRALRLENVLFPLKLIVSLIQSLLLVRKFRPHLVLGTGGYVAGPVVFAGTLFGIPTVIHESNSYPGVTTRLLNKKVNKTLITFDHTRKWLKRTDNVELVGNPTRPELGTVSREEGARYFGLKPERKTLLVFGGSSGARSLNRALEHVCDDLVAKGIQVIWQTGAHDFRAITAKYARSESGLVSEGLWIGDFIDRMECAYAAADLVVCRSGAMTIAELMRLAKPAIVVPYPFAAANHQLLNAQALVNAGAARMIQDQELDKRLGNTISELIGDDNALRTMGNAARRMGNPDAGKQIAQIILEMIS